MRVCIVNTSMLNTSSRRVCNHSFLNIGRVKLKAENHNKEAGRIHTLKSLCSVCSKTLYKTQVIGLYLLVLSMSKVTTQH